jgi:hypothetical protein
MANRFIIGKGELLTYDIPPPPMVSKKAHPYSLDEAKVFVIPQIRQAVADLQQLPAAACPLDFAVAKLQLHPAYISKSFFPKALLRDAGLVSVGSRTIRSSPRRDLRKKAPLECDTTELFVAGTRAVLSRLPELAQALEDGTTAALQFREVEHFMSMQATDRVRMCEGEPGRVFEVGLHLIPDQPPELLRKAFSAFAGECGFKVNTQYEFPVGRMLFLAIEGDAAALPELAPGCSRFQASHSLSVVHRATGGNPGRRPA